MNENYNVHLTFKTDKFTSEKLKVLAHYMNKTQPELINELCKSFIKNIENDIIKTLSTEEADKFKKITEEIKELQIK